MTRYDISISLGQYQAGVDAVLADLRVKRVIARIWSHDYTLWKQDPTEISNRLGVSKSNISINIRMLEEYGLVRKVWVKGSRKDYYAAERTYPKKVLGDFLHKIKGTLTDAITTVERTRAKATEAKVTLPADRKAQADFILQQVNLIGLFYYAADNFFEDFFSGKPVNIEILQRIILNPEDLGKGKR